HGAAEGHHVRRALARRAAAAGGDLGVAVVVLRGADVLAALLRRAVRQPLLGALSVAARLALEELGDVSPDLPLALEEVLRRGDVPRIVAAERSRSLAVYLAVEGIEDAVPGPAHGVGVEARRGRRGSGKQLRVRGVVLRRATGLAILLGGRIRKLPFRALLVALELALLVPG